MSAESYTPSADDLRGNELQKPEVVGREAEIAAERVETGKTLQEMAKKVSRELVAAGVIGLNALVPFVGTAEAGAAELPKDGKLAVERVQERVFPGEIAPIKNGRIMTGQENYDYIYKATVVRRPGAIIIERTSRPYEENNFGGINVVPKYKNKKKTVLNMNDFTFLFEGKLMVAIQKPASESQAKDKSKYVFQEKYDLRKVFNVPPNSRISLDIYRYDDYDVFEGICHTDLKSGGFSVNRTQLYYKDGHLFKDWASLQGAQDLIKYPNLPVVRFDGPPKSKAEVVAIGRKLEAFRDEQLRGVDLKRVENEEAYKDMEESITYLYSDEGVNFLMKASQSEINTTNKMIGDLIKNMYLLVNPK